MPGSVAPLAVQAKNSEEAVLKDVKAVHFLATAYCCKFGPGSINGEGVTKDGTDLRDCKQVYGIAAGPGSGLSMGDIVRIDPNPFSSSVNFKVFDTGGAIIGRHIDIYVADCKKAREWGHKAVTVKKIPDSVATHMSPGDKITDPITAVTDPIVGVAKSIGSLVSVLAKLVDSLTSSATWFRVGKVVVGVMIGYYGFTVLFKVNPVKDVASKAAVAAAV